MSNCSQSVRAFPCANLPYLLEYGTNTVKLEEILISFKALTTSKLKIQATWQINGTSWFFQDHLDSFQDPYLNHHKFNIFWLYLVHFPPKHMSTVKLSNFSTYCVPAGPLWLPMSKFGAFSKTHKKGSNFHNRGSSQLKLTSEMTTTGAHIVSKFQSLYS